MIGLQWEIIIIAILAAITCAILGGIPRIAKDEYDKRCH
jgi:hypothetical protein